MTTGTATFPTVIPTPMSTVPASAQGRPSRERRTIPASSTTSETATPRPSPARASSAEAAGVASAKHSTGRLVSSPAVAAPIPRSAAITSRTGETATIGPRRFRPSSRIAATSTAAGTTRPGAAAGAGAGRAAVT